MDLQSTVCSFPALSFTCLFDFVVMYVNRAFRLPGRSLKIFSNGTSLLLPSSGGRACMGKI